MTDLKEMERDLPDIEAQITTAGRVLLVLLVIVPFLLGMAVGYLLGAR